MLSLLLPKIPSPRKDSLPSAFKGRTRTALSMSCPSAPWFSLREEVSWKWPMAFQVALLDMVVGSKCPHGWLLGGRTFSGPIFGCRHRKALKPCASPLPRSLTYRTLACRKSSGSMTDKIHFHFSLIKKSHSCQLQTMEIYHNNISSKL